MMTPSELKTLAGRVEAATGPDRELDFDILRATSPTFETDWRDLQKYRGKPVWVSMRDNHPTDPVLAYTASLDAAMTLATGFALLHLSDIGADGLPLCKLGDPGTTPAGEWTGIASRLELAVCSAALRARANQGATDE